VNDIPLEEIEDKLLTVRRTWKQPSRDDKILCGINALLAVSMIQAGRFLGRLDLEKNATYLVLSILNKFWDGKSLKHSFYNGSFEEINFLFDAAALLTAISMLYETEDSWGNLATTMAAYVESFREGSIWREASAPDFQTVYASWTDHPAPSSVSLAEMGLTRVKLISGEDISSKEFREPFKSDFYNITSMMSNGLFHIVESANNLSWSKLPVNTIMIRGTHETDCFMGTCRPLGNEFKSD
jgi:uncharacterized protein YyaL (SSP411 family)